MHLNYTIEFPKCITLSPIKNPSPTPKIKKNPPLEDPNAKYRHNDHHVNLSILSRSTCMYLEYEYSFEKILNGVLFERNDLTQFMICSDMPKYFILYSSLLY